MVTTARGSQSQVKQIANALQGGCQVRMVPTTWGISLKKKVQYFLPPQHPISNGGTIFRVVS